MGLHINKNEIPFYCNCILPLLALLLKLVLKVGRYT